MTIQAASEFRVVINNDPALIDIIRSLQGNDGMLDLPATVELGAQHGFIFTETDIDAVLAANDDELSDFELEMVAAGVPVVCDENTIDA